MSAFDGTRLSADLFNLSLCLKSARVETLTGGVWISIQMDVEIGYRLQRVISVVSARSQPVLDLND